MYEIQVERIENSRVTLRVLPVVEESIDAIPPDHAGILLSFVRGFEIPEEDDDEEEHRTALEDEIDEDDILDEDWLKDNAHRFICRYVSIEVNPPADVSDYLESIGGAIELEGSLDCLSPLPDPGQYFEWRCAMEFTDPKWVSHLSVGARAENEGSSIPPTSRYEKEGSHDCAQEWDRQAQAWRDVDPRETFRALSE